MSLHHRIFVFDAHCDTLGDAVESLYRPRDLTQWGERGFLDLPRMTAGGINCQIFACFPGVTRLQHGATAAALERVEAFYDLLARAPDRISLVRTARDLAQLSPDGPIGGILGLEGAEALEGSLRRLETFFRLGVRNLGLAWNARNAACDGVGVGSACGLTPFGRDVVARCRELGVMIDVSHLNAAGLEDVLEMSEGPVIASHSNARALCSHRRNLDDDQIRAIAAGGGVVCVTFIDYFLTDEPPATLDDVLDHIDHMVQVAGVDHVGLGSDYFDRATPPPDLDSGEKYPNITDGLLGRGYHEEEIAKILGENLRRVFLEILP